MTDELSGKAQDTGCGIGGTLMRTISGKCVDPLNFTADDLDIRDIAHALARQCRYNGHSFGHLSVARHSLWVSERLGDLYEGDKELRLAGLLHDAAEAYTGDLIRPLKHRPELAAFLEVEASIEQVIAEAYDVPLGHSAIKEADVWVLTHIEVEARKSWDSNAMDDKQKFLIEAHDLGINWRHA